MKEENNENHKKTSEDDKDNKSMSKKSNTNLINKAISYANKNAPKIFMVLIIGLFLVSLLNIFSITTANLILIDKIKKIKEFNKPSKIQLFIINCKDCSDINPVIESIKKQNVEITEEKILDYSSEEAKSLIATYNIQKLPTVLISGDYNKTNFNNFELINNALVLKDINAPYYDLTANKIRGEVSIIEITDSSCENCISLTSIPDSFGQAGVLIKDWQKIEYSSIKGKEFINNFGIKKVPSLLISNDINYYDEIKQSLSQLNLIEKSGFYIIHSTIPPYRDLIKNKVVGLVDLIMLTDDSCDNCYDVELNKQILARLGLVINSEKTYDINSVKGKQLLSKYNIEKVPVIILSPDAKEYPVFMRLWNQIGTIEKDGWSVMRKPELIGTSKDITTNEIIKK